jgi:hypothetical protein
MNATGFISSTISKNGLTKGRCEDIPLNGKSLAREINYSLGESDTLF